jgi:hypothetical protein
LKGYLLLEQGDFFVHFLDLAEEELLKKCSEINKGNLESIFELALRTATPLSNIDHFSSTSASSPSSTTQKKNRNIMELESKTDFIDHITFVLLPHNLTTHVNHLIEVINGKVCIDFPSPKNNRLRRDFESMELL